MFRAFEYSPQALQIVEPLGDRRQRGVRVVAQLLEIGCQCPTADNDFTLGVRTCRLDPEEVDC